MTKQDFTVYDKQTNRHISHNEIWDIWDNTEERLGSDTLKDAFFCWLNGDERISFIRNLRQQYALDTDQETGNYLDPFQAEEE